MGPLIAQALRRTTGVGVACQDSNSGSPTSFFANISCDHQPGVPADPQTSFCRPLASASAFNGPTSGVHVTTGRTDDKPTSGMGAATLRSDGPRPNLTLLTDVGRRYPGFPTPLSPTSSAKEMFPTPISDSGSRIATPQIGSPNVHFVSPVSLDGSNAYEAPPFYPLYNYEDFSRQMGNIDTVLARGTSMSESRRSPALPSTPSLNPTSPRSSHRALSPRIDMLRYRATKQAFHTLPSPIAASAVPVELSPATRNNRRHSIVSLELESSQSVGAFPPFSYQQGPTPSSRPSIQIANGTEFETESPISPSGIMLSYASNRAVDSGLLAVPALSEPQVAEYRFWVPCGRRVCGFGCGEMHEGEHAAAKRLFKDAEDVTQQQAAKEDDTYEEGEDNLMKMSPAVSQQSVRGEWTTSNFTKPVDEWRRFLMNKERDVSVAKV